MTAVGAAQAAADLSAQVNTVITWAALKKVAISGSDLTDYCTAVSACLACLACLCRLVFGVC
jgi:hypothetical protein